MIYMYFFNPPILFKKKKLYSEWKNPKNMQNFAKQMHFYPCKNHYFIIT